jgi:hypothetical protein
MRRVPLAGAVVLLALAGCNNDQPKDDPATTYQETVRCYNAAANFAQQYVVAGATAQQDAMMGYSAELRGRAYALGNKLGRSSAAVKADFRDDDSAYLHRFYSFANGTMALTDFGNGEVKYCKLEKVLPQ